MRKILILTVFMLACAPFVCAQTGSGDDQPKVTFFGGYSFERLDPVGDGFNLNGFDTQVTGYFNKYIGVKGDFSGHFRSEDFTADFCATAPCPTFRQRTQLYNVLAGPEFRAPNSSRVTPFAHALAGVAHLRQHFSSSAGTAATGTDTEFALAIGGGLDVRLNDRFDFRAVQVDWNPVVAGGSRADAVRVSVGIVIK